MKNSALFVLCALLTACGGSDDNKTTNQTTIQSYTITTNVEGEGQVQPTSLVLKQGESGTFELKSEQGYQVASVEGCNGTYSDSKYTIENATQSCQVTAKFEAKTINVALKSDAYITLSTDKDDYVYGDSAVISYELSPGYLLAEITGCNGALNGELYKVDALTADCQITATTLPTSQLFSGEDEAKVNVTVLDGKGGFLPSSKGIIEPSNSELPPLNNSLEFERDLLAVDIATEAGQTIELQITYETPLPTQFTYQKLIEQQWQALDQANVTVSEDRLTLTLALTDGGAGDSDGLVNGIIKDPGGPAVVKMHTVTINQSAGGAITPESLAVAHGDTALFTISTDAGYTLESVTGCNGTLNGTSYQTAAITQNCEISAEFSLRSFLVTAQAGEGGQISPLEQLASYGNTLTFTVTSDDDHNIESVQGCNGSLAGNIYTTGILTAGCEVRASFDPQKVLVTAQSGAGGSISPMSQELNVGQQANLIVSPNEGYSIANVIGCSGSLSGNTYTTGVVTANCQVQASFSIDSYTVSASAGEGGTVNPATQNVNHGSRAQITITPNSGYNIDTVTGCNGTLSGNTYTTSAITANCQVQASFSIDSYTVSASASEGGTVTPTTQSVNHGSSAKIIITPNSGYNIDAVTGCSGSLNGNTYTTSAITANCQVQASFSINNYTVTASAGEGGAVNPATQSVNHGSSAQITITPNEGYSIDTVTGCNGTLSGNTYTTSAVTANCQVQASFSIDSYTVSASAGEGGTVNPATQNVNHGSRAQITITPNSGYNIDAVTGCSGSLNGNTYTTSAITANCQVQASFSINSYTVSASTGEGGTVNPTTQSVNHGSSAQIMITPNEGYSIDTVTGCNGSLNDNIYTTDAVTANCEVQASFGATHYKVKQSGFNDYQLQISIDGQDWFDFTADTNLPLTNGIGQEVFYMLVDGQLFTLTCNIENCIVTPYTLLVNYLSQAFSENSSTQAGSLLDETLGLQIDPFVKDSTTFNTVRFNSWVTDSSLFNVIATITGDVIDGYVDEQRVIALSTNAKQRAIEEIIVEVGELPEASEGETLQIYSISTESSSQQQGETKGYLSDYVMQTEFVDPDTQEVTKDIVYLSFNTGRWKGKLNAETHTFSSLFIGTPEWLFLPEAEKVKIAENLENNTLFKEAVATYQSVIVDVNSLKLIKYNQLLEQIQLTAPTLRESQLQVLQQSIASQVNQNNAQIIPQNVIKSQQLQNNAISCEAKVENRVLVSGILLDQLKIGMNRTCDQTTLASRMAVWYAWGKKNKLTKDQSFWDELNNTQMVAPKNFTDIKAKGSNINDLENGLTYTLYKKHPHKFVSKPMVYNTARAATLIIKVVFGAQPALGDKFPKKLKEVADTAKAAKEKLENYLIFAEGALAGSQLIVEIIEPLLKEENKNSEFYVESKKILRNAQKAVTDISSLLGAIATPDEVAVLDFKDEYEKIKRTLGSKHAGKLKKHTHLTVKNALVFTMLRVFSDDNGDIQFGKTKVPAKAIALRLALYDLQSLVGKANIGKRAKLKSLLKKLGVADEKTYVAVMQLSPDSISTAIIAKASTKEFRNDILKLINVDPDNLAKTVTETLKSLASETFQNKDEVLKTVIWALVDGFINNASTNVVPALIKSMGPQKYAQLILSGAEIGAFAVDLAIKPDYLNFKTKACDENSAQTCFEVAAPPLEVLPYIVAVDTPNDSQRKNGVYVLDSSAWLSAQSEHDEHSWPDDTVDYLAAMPIRNNHESAMLVLSGAALSYEIDAFVAPHQFKDFESFISLMESDKRSLNFDWFVYPYKNSEWPNIVGTQLPVRSRGNSLASNNYKPIAIDAGEYDCDLQSGWLKCKDVFLRAKSSNLRNPVLTQFIKQQIAANTQQDKEYQVDLDNLAFLSFTKATKKVGWDEYATFTSPGIRNISSHMELGDAKWETDVDIYVIPDYLKQDSEHISHLEAFIGQSAIEINKQGEVIGLNARLRRADNFNYFGEQKEQTYRIDNQFFYPVIKAYNSQTKQTVYFKGEPILLNRVDGQSISLKQLPQGYQAQKVYIYDSVFANYLENVGGSFVTWLERRAGRIHYFVNSAKDPSRQVAKGEFAGLPYLIVDLNTTTMKRVTVQDELTALQDSDGDDVPDELDTYPDDMRYAFDSDLDGMADKWEEAYGFNPFNSESMNNQGPNDDYDDDSFSNLVEFAKTLELSKDYSGYNPTIKTAQWKSDSQKVKQQNSQPIEVSLNDWLILYQDQVAQSISIEVGNSFTDELPIIELTADKQQIEISLPESWPEQQIKTVKLVLKLNTGELAVSDKPLNEGGAQGDLVEYLSLFLSKDMQGDNWVLGVEFTDTHFAQCVQAHVDAQQVTRLADLTTLNCSNENIASVAELSHMTGLTSLNLANNSLTTINLNDNLALNSADLRGNQFDQATLDYLAAITRITDLKYLKTPPPTTTTGKLNDTGITWCADSNNNNLDCPVTGYEGQDAEYGRDAEAKAGTLEKVGGGNGGFDFTKLDASGNDLPESASVWSCVRDNHTGLIWEVKTDDGGLHDKNDTYNWYNPDSNTNGGHPGHQDDDGNICYGYDANNEASYCNTHAYVERVNTQSLCGASDWRMPTRLELMGIVDNGTKKPAIDMGYFPQTQLSWFWSSSPYVVNGGVWYVGFGNGYVGYGGTKDFNNYVRLTRAVR
ncbi:DUF1566 domain-containing protein [uncultured Pseudoalteromonas sp.]|uniref:InlB B-repeat-containing protein n=1 Tax=uncultured Pseudoalteromonas sp. TaxID=114053 RepID=UPI0025994AB7|nr:DUF1566 domain-containing protein [uncultured Pseudoalteromonas sp.]